MTIFQENTWGFDGKSRHLILKVSGKTVAKSLADIVVQLAVLCFYIRRIVHDSATVNFFFFFTEDE